MGNAKFPQTVVGIPGRWDSQSDIMTSIVRKSGGWLFSGVMMMHIETHVHFQVDVANHDERMADAFLAAGGDRLSSEGLEAIATHTHCLYLVGDGGSLETARNFLVAANAMLRCGGLGVKVESAGIAHSSADWKRLTEDGSSSALLKAFVTLARDEAEFYSCGMHNLGYRDCVVEAPVEPDEAGRLMNTFLQFLVIDDPVMNSGETFSVDADAPRYRVFREDCTRYEADDLFHNPYGIWRLVPA